MTNNTAQPIPVPTVDSQGRPDDDPRRAYARSVATAGAVIATVTEAEAANPSPCEGWTAGDVVGHLIAVVDRVAAIGKGISADDLPLVREDVSHATWVSAWDEAVAATDKVWADDSLLGRNVTVPWAVIPGGVAMAIYATEILVHTWDLSTAIGRQPVWFEADVARGLEVVQFGIPAEPRGGDIPFSAVTPTADDAPTVDKLAAWMGRTIS